MYKSKEITVGPIKLGGNQAVVIQSMTDVSLQKEQESVDQIIALVKAGCQLVRLAVVSVSEIEQVRNIKNLLLEKGYDVPLIADIHHHPGLAEKLVGEVEKIRINPGNFNGNPRKDWNTSNSLYEYKKIEKKFKAFLSLCKKHQTCIRIGVNHGSLSDRILSKYGNTPEGMVASVMEFARICKKSSFDRVIVSIKSSNPVIMIQSNRLLVQQLMAEGMNYPVHLGVTEAGNGLEGKLKSMLGIGTLLQEGIGDTIRVSLTEPPVNEIPVAQALVHKSTAFVPNRSSVCEQKRKPLLIGNKMDDTLLSLESYYTYVSRRESLHAPIGKYILPYEDWVKLTKPDTFPLIRTDMKIPEKWSSNMSFIHITKQGDAVKKWQNKLANTKAAWIVDDVENTIDIVDQINAQAVHQIIYKIHSDQSDENEFLAEVCLKAGHLLMENQVDGTWLSSTHFDADFCHEVSQHLLQITERLQLKPAYIACPGCGRTKFNLLSTTNAIKARTSHLKHLKIGIMGCVINGIGEMGEADYGYVGAGNGKINLYRKNELVKKSIPENKAVEEMLALISEDEQTTENIEI